MSLGYAEDANFAFNLFEYKAHTDDLLGLKGGKMTPMERTHFTKGFYRALTVAAYVGGSLPLPTRLLQLLDTLEFEQMQEVMRWLLDEKSYHDECPWFQKLVCAKRDLMFLTIDLSHVAAAAGFPNTAFLPRYHESFDSEYTRHKFCYYIIRDFYQNPHITRREVQLAKLLPLQPPSPPKRYRLEQIQERSAST